MPIPDAAAEPPIPTLVGRPFIAAVGTLERRKNLPVLVEAFGLLAAEHDEILLVLAGADGDDRPAINAAIDGLDPAAAKRVVMTGRIDEPARSWLLRHATVLAYPSLDEGFGFPLLDAMQVGVPIVASNRGSIPGGLWSGRAAVRSRRCDRVRRQPHDGRVRRQRSGQVAGGIRRRSWRRSRGSDARPSWLRSTVAWPTRHAA